MVIRGFNCLIKKFAAKKTNKEYVNFPSQTMTWFQIIKDVVVNATHKRGRGHRMPFVSVTPIISGPNVDSATSVYHNNKKGAPVGKDNKQRETDSLLYKLVHTMEG